MFIIIQSERTAQGVLERSQDHANMGTNIFRLKPEVNLQCEKYFI